MAPLNGFLPSLTFSCRLQEVWSCWIELLHYLDLETTWLSTLEERMKSTEALPEKADALSEALEVGTYIIRSISFCCKGAKWWWTWGTEGFMSTNAFASSPVSGVPSVSFCGWSSLYSHVYLGHWWPANWASWGTLAGWWLAHFRHCKAL